MKKLFTLISFLAFFSLIFIGCQSTEDITAPNNELDKTASSFSFPSCPLSPIDGEVDMVAGQHNPVGTVSFSWDGSSFLTVTYATTLASGLTMSEIHLDFAQVLNNNPITGFHLNKQNNPQVGHFDINESFDPRVSSKTYQISKSELLGFLGLNPTSGTLPDFIYIAAHGVVGTGGDCSNAPCPDLPESASMFPAFYSGTDVTAGNYAFRARPDFNWSDGTNSGTGINYYIPAGTTERVYFNGWCIDQQNGIRSLTLRDVKFLCSYDYDAYKAAGGCDFINLDQNLDLINWIINNRDGYDLWDVQAAIWDLIDPIPDRPGVPTDWLLVLIEANITQLKNDAMANGEGFVPGCGQKVAVIVYSVDENCDVLYQSLIIEKPVCCGDETAWGFDWDFVNQQPEDGLSCRFVEQGNWARYFQFRF